MRPGSLRPMVGGQADIRRGLHESVISRTRGTHGRPGISHPSRPCPGLLNPRHHSLPTLAARRDTVVRPSRRHRKSIIDKNPRPVTITGSRHPRTATPASARSSTSMAVTLDRRRVVGAHCCAPTLRTECATRRGIRLDHENELKIGTAYKWCAVPGDGPVSTRRALQAAAGLTLSRMASSPGSRWPWLRVLERLKKMSLGPRWPWWARLS